MPSDSYSTETILPVVSRLTVVTRAFLRMAPPSAVTRPATVSHICPGPSFGYLNRSISDVSTCLPLMPSVRVRMSFITAVMDIPFTLWLPHAASISLGWRPQRFSV